MMSSMREGSDHRSGASEQPDLWRQDIHKKECSVGRDCKVHLFSYGSRTKNDFYIFKGCKQIKKKSRAAKPKMCIIWLSLKSLPTPAPSSEHNEVYTLSYLTAKSNFVIDWCCCSKNIFWVLTKGQAFIQVLVGERSKYRRKEILLSLPLEKREKDKN